MHFRGVPLESVGESQLLSLVDNRVPESRTLDYKLELPGGSDADRREFLADISAFANTVGGWLVYGIETEQDSDGKDTGIPVRISELSANVDATTQRLHAMVHDGLSPSLRAQTEIRAIPVASGNVFLVGVPHSLIGPHMVTFKGTRRFHRRSEAGKYEPDVAELRQMFLDAGTWLDEVEAFRVSRLRQLLRGRAVPNLERSSGMVVHVLPLGRLADYIDLRPHHGQLAAIAPPYRGGGWSHRYNWDGFQTYNGPPDTCVSFTQWFRTGGAEGYISGIRSENPAQVNGPEIIDTSHEFATEAVKTMHDVLAVDPPYSVALSVFGVGSARLIASRRGRMAPTPFIRPRYLLPPVLLEDVPANMEAVLLQSLEILWQAAGVPSIGSVQG